MSGGERGEMAIFDLRQRRIREKWAAHSMAIQAMALAEERWCFSTSADSDIKLWSVDAPCALPADSEAPASTEGQPQGHWAQAHEPHHILAPLVGTKLGRCGVTSLTLMPGVWPSVRGVSACSAGLISGGADGKVKMWRYT